MEIQANQIQCAPIGVFDSGVGGLSVWREIVSCLPSESIVYFADSANCPYGTKSQEEIIAFCDRIVHFLIDQQCKLIVVACNTATAMAIEYLRASFNLPFVGMEPALKPAALESNTGVIGILATAGTFKGRLFNETKARFAEKVKVIMTVGEGLVELVEQGKTGTAEARKLLRSYIEPMLEEGADRLVLGCTHYPFLADDIDDIAGGKLKLIDPAVAIAHRVAYLLEQGELKCHESVQQPYYHFYSSGDNIQVLSSMVRNITKKNYSVFQTHG